MTLFCKRSHIQDTSIKYPKLSQYLANQDFMFNDLKFHIKYKTQDTLRISQFKPNLYNFMKNSKFEKYPHHEQYFGQEDKIVDSERFSANLWGRLVRIANGIYQCNEYAEVGEEKEVGDLVMIKTVFTNIKGVQPVVMFFDAARQRVHT